MQRPARRGAGGGRSARSARSTSKPAPTSIVSSPRHVAAAGQRAGERKRGGVASPSTAFGVDRERGLAERRTRPRTMTAARAARSPGSRRHVGANSSGKALRRSTSASSTTATAARTIHAAADGAPEPQPPAVRRAAGRLGERRVERDAARRTVGGDRATGAAGRSSVACPGASLGIHGIRLPGDGGAAGDVGMRQRRVGATSWTERNGQDAARSTSRSRWRPPVASTLSRGRPIDRIVELVTGWTRRRRQLTPPPKFVVSREADQRPRPAEAAVLGAARRRRAAR